MTTGNYLTLIRKSWEILTKYWLNTSRCENKLANLLYIILLSKTNICDQPSSEI